MMGESQLSVRPIGVIRSPHRGEAGTPIQPHLARQSGTVVVNPAYADGLADLAGFERIWLLFWFDRARPYRLRVVPYRDTVERGLFATRAPSRPNPIGLSVVELLAVDDNRLEVAGVDILDRTPLLDIKPYVPEFDAFADSRSGWLASGEGRRLADRRFTRDDD